MSARVVTFGPRDDHQQGIARQEIVETLKALLDGQQNLAAFSGNFKIALDERVWEQERVSASGKPITPVSFHTFVHEPYPVGLSASYETVERLIADDAEAIALYREVSRRPVGANQHGEGSNIVITLPKRPLGNSAAAAVDKLSREAEAGNDIAAQALEAVKSGTKSPHRAMVECGFRKGIDPEVKALAARDAAEMAVALSEGDLERLTAFEHLLRKAGAKNVADQIANIVDPAVMGGGRI